MTPLSITPRAIMTTSSNVIFDTSGEKQLSTEIPREYVRYNHYTIRVPDDPSSGKCLGGANMRRLSRVSERDNIRPKYMPNLRAPTIRAGSLAVCRNYAASNGDTSNYVYQKSTGNCMLFDANQYFRERADVGNSGGFTSIVGFVDAAGNNTHSLYANSRISTNWEKGGVWMADAFPFAWTGGVRQTSFNDCALAANQLGAFGTYDAARSQCWMHNMQQVSDNDFVSGRIDSMKESNVLAGEIKSVALPCGAPTSVAYPDENGQFLTVDSRATLLPPNSYYQGNASLGTIDINGDEQFTNVNAAYVVPDIPANTSVGSRILATIKDPAQRVMRYLSGSTTYSKFEIYPYPPLVGVRVGNTTIDPSVVPQGFDPVDWFDGAVIGITFPFQGTSETVTIVDVNSGALHAVPIPAANSSVFYAYARSLVPLFVAEKFDAKTPTLTFRMYAPEYRSLNGKFINVISTNDRFGAASTLNVQPGNTSKDVGGTQFTFLCYNRDSSATCAGLYSVRGKIPDYYNFGMPLDLTSTNLAPIDSVETARATFAVSPATPGSQADGFTIGVRTTPRIIGIPGFKVMVFRLSPAMTRYYNFANPNVPRAEQRRLLYGECLAKEGTEQRDTIVDRIAKSFGLGTYNTDFATVRARSGCETIVTDYAIPQYNLLTPDDKRRTEKYCLQNPGGACDQFADLHCSKKDNYGNPFCQCNSNVFPRNVQASPSVKDFLQRQGGIFPECNWGLCMNPGSYKNAVQRDRIERKACPATQTCMQVINKITAEDGGAINDVDVNQSCSLEVGDSAKPPRQIEAPVGPLPAQPPVNTFSQPSFTQMSRTSLYLLIFLLFAIVIGIVYATML